MLCGKGPGSIVQEFDRCSLILPEQRDTYHSEQQEWLWHTLGRRVVRVPEAMRSAGLHDMYAAHKHRPSGKTCLYAYQLLAFPEIRKPVEALLWAGFSASEIERAVNCSLYVPYKIDTETVHKYQKYFFGFQRLAASDKNLMMVRNQHLQLASMAIPTDLLLYGLGLRYVEDTDMVSRAFDAALKKWLLHLEAMPLRLDREGLKTAATFVNSVKSLDRYAPGAASETDNILLRLKKQQHPDYQESIDAGTESTLH